MRGKVQMIFKKSELASLPASLRLRQGGSRRRDGLVSAAAGFTLVELLIVIAILAILAAAVVIVLNPSELIAEARDAERVTSLESLRKSVDLFIIDNPSASQGVSQTVYVSVPDTSATCANIGLPTLPSGWAYNCVTSAALRNVDGSGWIPINFSLIKGGSPIPYLPIDPVNDVVSGRYYTYAPGGSYEITALMEADKVSASVGDGGALPGVYEVGTHIGLTPSLRDKGLIGYWAMDEGSGTTTRDSSGKGNIGTISGPVWFNPGKTGNALNFLGSGSPVINVSHNASLNVGSNDFTIMGWAFHRDLTYPKSNFMFKKSNSCYSDGVANAGFDIGHGVDSTGVDICLRDSNNNYLRQKIAFNSGQLPANLLNKWTHYVFVFDRGDKRIRVYIDGVKQTNEMNISSVSGSLNSTYALSIGTMYGWQTDGMLDEMRMYSRSLSELEIKSIYDAKK